SNWWGITYDKAHGLLIGNVIDAAQFGRLQEGGGRRGGEPPAAGAAPAPAGPLTYSKTPGPSNRFWNNEKMWGCNGSRWGELIAVNANTGDIAWRVPLGEFEELTKLGVKQTGTPSSGGAISTAGNLVFIGATIDGYFRAFDSRNGKELWAAKLDAPAHSIPSTYMGKDGKQYVVVTAGGGGFLRSPLSDELIAFRLP